MKRNKRPLAIALMALLAAGCGSGDSSGKHNEAASGSGAPVEVVKGFAVHGHEVRAFRPCGTDEEVWVIDRTGVLWDVHKGLALGREPYEELFAVVMGRFGPPPEDGFGAEYGRALEVTEVIYVALEGFRCNLDLDSFRYRTFGNEPFWSASISPDGIVLRMPGYEDRSWTDIDERPFDGGIMFSADGPPGQVRIRIFELPCRDTMSGAYFASSAEMRLGHDTFRGCALRGTARPGNRSQ
ncbi:MAG: hypothetical protein PVJ42_05895 [bacterium]